MNKLLPILILFLLFLPISLAIPNGIPIQGILTDLNENPQTGDFQFTFSLVNQSGEVWTETKTITTDSNGYFSTQINPTGIDFSKDYNLSITVESDNLGQIPLLSSPYSLYSNDSQRLQGHEPSYFLDTSSTPQTKEGNLTVNSYIIAQSGLCIGADCITNGPIGDITSITAGSGLTGGGTSGDITIGLAHPSKSCSANSAIQSFDISSSSGPTCINNVVTGSGTSGYIPKFTGARSLGNSVIYQSSGNVGIGTTSPGYKLDVNGTIKVRNIRLYYHGNISDVRNIIGSFGINIYSDINEYNYEPPIIRIVSGSIVGNTGRIGIGVVNPSAKLDVNGSAIIRGNLDVSGFITGSGSIARGDGLLRGNFGYWMNSGSFYSGNDVCDHYDENCIAVYQYDSSEEKWVSFNCNDGRKGWAWYPNDPATGTGDSYIAYCQ